jgi:hypothetical protein
MTGPPSGPSALTHRTRLGRTGFLGGAERSEDTRSRFRLYTFMYKVYSPAIAPYARSDRYVDLR